MTVPIVVRPVATVEERDRQFYLSDIAFSENPSPENVTFWQEYVTTLPYYHPERIRGAFKDDTLLGGYELFEREMHMGQARLLTGCIGSVNTDPQQRLQGVASALMHDAIDYARQHHYALLLLDGIPKFYYRFGYSDVFEVIQQDIDRSAVLAQQPSSYTVRPATVEDAPDVLALYERQHYRYTASFTRPLELQQHFLRHRSSENPYLLACDEHGQVRGLLAIRKAPERYIADELLVDDWQATLALLQYHAQQLSGEEQPAILRYRIPTDSSSTYWIIAHLQLPDTNNQRDPNAFGSVLSRTFHHRHTGWMARVIDLQEVVRACLPEWQQRWHLGLASWSGKLVFSIDGETFALNIAGREISQGDAQDIEGELVLHFSQQAFTQLLFGYRPVSWFLRENEIHAPTGVEAALHILFPPGHTCITRSDDF